MATGTVGLIPGTGTPGSVAQSRYIGVSDQAGNVPQIQYSISEEIYLLNGKATPFTLFSQALGTLSGHDNKYRWQEDTLVDQNSTTSGSTESDGATLTLTTGHGARWTVNDVIYVVGVATAAGTGADGYVTEKATDVLYVTWNHAPTAGIPNGTTVFRIGNAHPEISQVEIGPTTKTAELDNYFQDMRHGLMASDLYIQGTWFFNPGDWERQKTKKRTEHLLELEKTRIWGQKTEDTSGNFPRRFAEGIYYFAATNVTSLSAALTQARLDTFLDGTMYKQTDPNTNWVLFTSDRISEDISQLSQGLERTDTTKSQFGMGIGQYKAPNQQVVKIVHHPMFEDHGFNDMAILLNMTKDVCRIVTHTIFGTKQYDAVIPYGISALETYWRTVCTLQLRGESINVGVLTDVT